MDELALHILDLGQNSLAADCSLIEITVTDDLKAGDLLISIRDDGIGMGKWLQERVLEPGITTKGIGAEGRGLPLLKEVACRCDGEVEVRSAVGQGTEVQAVFRRAHSDLPPLGDMGATIMTLLMNGRHVNIVYRHVVSRRIYVFDTRDEKMRLGSGELPQPKALLSIRSMINDGVAKLYGGE